MTDEIEEAIDTAPPIEDIQIPPPPPPTHCALLDESGIYIGMVEVPAEPTSRHLLEISSCDLPPGRYRWNAVDGCFDVAAVESLAAAPCVPSLERAVFSLARAFESAGNPLPADVASWCAWYQKTLEGA